MIDWPTFGVIVGAMLPVGIFILRSIHRMRNNDLKHVELELQHLRGDLDRIEKSHNDHRHDMSEKFAGIYERLEAHTTNWHLPK